MKYILIILLLFQTLNLNAQDLQMGIDTVFSFTPGKGQNVGQSEEYFPENIFREPDTNARLDRQSAMPENVCSLGFGGEIIVGFKDHVIYDGDGPDFTIFENAFLQAFNDKIFAEPGIVSVSMDGIEYIEFPYDPTTLVGCAGVTPTNGEKNPYDPTESGGDQFDLADLGLSQIKYIKITDYTLTIKNNTDHPFYDPTLSGFDLDAVVGLNLGNQTADIRETHTFEQFSIKYSNGQISVKRSSDADAILKIYDIKGRLILERTIHGSYEMIQQSITPGVYIALMISENRLTSKKLMVY